MLAYLQQTVFASKQKSAPTHPVLIKCHPQDDNNTILSHEQYIIHCIAMEIESRLVVVEEEMLTSFCGKQLPTISLELYIARLVRHVNQKTLYPANVRSAGLQCALVALEYLDGIQLTLNSQHRLFMTAFVIAIKMYGWDDGKEVSNRALVEPTGCVLQDINWMEMLFCTRLLQWNFSVSGEAIDHRVDSFVGDRP
ncbi:hypothetical protein BASA81_006827 [Batrachochytrium salamandrivorans]|nr:hypothetical protein BASA81_006827 [Batrachochytrium salamandrivorans]